MKCFTDCQSVRISKKEILNYSFFGREKKMGQQSFLFCLRRALSVARKCKVPLMVHHSVSTVPTDMSQGKDMVWKSDFTIMVSRKLLHL